MLVSLLIPNVSKFRSLKREINRINVAIVLLDDQLPAYSIIVVTKVFFCKDL